MKTATAWQQILEALDGSAEPSQFQSDLASPIPWPLNAPVLLWMLELGGIDVPEISTYPDQDLPA